MIYDLGRASIAMIAAALSDNSRSIKVVRWEDTPVAALPRTTPEAAMPEAAVERRAKPSRELSEHDRACLARAEAKRERKRAKARSLVNHNNGEQ